MFNITPAQQDTINQLMNYDNMQTDVISMIGVAFKCKISAIDLMIKYCDAHGLVYSSAFSSLALDFYFGKEGEEEEESE